MSAGVLAGTSGHSGWYGYIQEENKTRTLWSGGSVINVAAAPDWTDRQGSEICSVRHTTPTSAL